MRGDLEAEIGEQWSRRQTATEGQLEVPIGAAAGGEELSLDLRVDGPHVLVEGPASSGKSELLRSLVTSLAIRHAPAAVSFLLAHTQAQRTFPARPPPPHPPTPAPSLTSTGP